MYIGDTWCFLYVLDTILFSKQTNRCMICILFFLLKNTANKYKKCQFNKQTAS